MKNILLSTIILGLSTIGFAQQPKLPPPFQTKSVRNFSNVIG